MLVALDSSEMRCYAWATEKDESPFYCPECRGDALLKKGRVMAHHFAHIPPYDCQYGAGESKVHYAIKHELLELLSAHSECERVDVERNLKGVRPDVSAVIRGQFVGIEIQRSTISPDYIYEKASRYHKLGIHVIWIIPGSGPQMTYREDDNAWVCRPKLWEMVLHSMFFGRVYYKGDGLFVNPVHFKEFHTYVDVKEWYDQYGDVQYGGGYTKNLKSLRSAVRPSQGSYHLVDDFSGRKRSFFSAKDWDIPECGVWMDRHNSWW